MEKKILKTKRRRQRDCVQCKKQRIGNYYRMSPIRKEVFICERCIKLVDVGKLELIAVVK